MHHAMGPALLVLLTTLGFTSSARAQAAQAGTSNSRWTVEVHGGGAFSTNPTDGTGSLPPAGEVFTTSTGQRSRRSSSWYFGDGAVLMNQINASFPGTVLNATGRITPLDPVLKQPGAARRNAGSVGFRIGYTITPRFTAELTLDARRDD